MIGLATGNLAGQVLVAMIRVYQIAISPWLGPACRFTPSCSAFAREAIERHGAVRGTWLALRRLSRCHPLGGAGYDPVPAATPPCRTEPSRVSDRACKTNAT